MFPFLASACLCGIACRYDGRASTHPKIAALYARGLALAVCPEILGGMSVPREPCELRAGRVVDAAGRDMTARFARGAREVLRIAREKDIALAVLKERSPSCGSACVYDGTFSGTLAAGKGVTATLLMANGIAVCSEETAPEALFL